MGGIYWIGQHELPRGRAHTGGSCESVVEKRDESDPKTWTCPRERPRL